MEEKISKTIITCDCCKIELKKRSIYTNCGKYQRDYITKEISENERIDICFDCAGKMFDVFIINNLSDKELKDMVDEFPKKMNPLGWHHQREIKIELPEEFQI